MKKIGIVLAIVVGLVLFAGCPTTDTGNAAPVQAASTAKTYSVDLNTLNYKIFSDSGNSLSGGGAGKKNATALPRRWDGVLFTFTGLPESVKSFNRITVNAKYFAANGDEIAQGDGKAMCVLIYDINGDLKGPEMGPGKNTPVKEFNVGGFSGLVSTDKGVRVTLNQVPGGILIQAADASVKFIELTQVTFHSGSAAGN
jgi:hypothetical protein